MTPGGPAGSLCRQLPLEASQTPFQSLRPSSGNCPQFKLGKYPGNVTVRHLDKTRCLGLCYLFKMNQVSLRNMKDQLELHAEALYMMSPTCHFSWPGSPGSGSIRIPGGTSGKGGGCMLGTRVQDLWTIQPYKSGSRHRGSGVWDQLLPCSVWVWSHCIDAVVKRL